MKNKDSKAAVAPPLRRFQTVRVVEHWTLMITFGVLILTGLSERYHAFESSQWLIFHLGGIDGVRLIHRYTGTVFSALILLHLAAGLYGVLARGWAPSMIIRKKDVYDAIHNIRYYLGMEARPAICGRYNYKQKFEYWSIVSGGIIMALSGFILWLPTVAVRFLPGEFIPAAKVVHANHAMVILSIIAIWHVYNAIFSPDVHPVDTSIFTGFISRMRMVQEHPIELARIEKRSLEDLLVEADQYRTGESVAPASAKSQVMEMDGP